MMPKKTEEVEVPVDDTPSTDVELEFRGVTFTFPRDRDEWPTKAIQAFSKRKYADGVEQVLGSMQWDMLNDIAPKYKDFFAFIEVFGELQDKECTGG